MSLDGALSIAASGLYTVQGQIAVVSQNVSNANTTGYVKEVANDTEQVAGDQADGVRLGAAVRITAPALQTSLFAQNATVSAQTVLSNAWSALTSVLGTTDSSTGSSGSLTDALSSLQAAFTTLQADPTSQTGQQVAIQAASSLTSIFHTIAATASTQRQAAADAAVSDVGTINDALGRIGVLSKQIITLQSSGASTAGLEDQRDAEMSVLSQKLDVTFTQSQNGAVTVRTRDGLLLPTDAASGPLSLAASTIGASDSHPGQTPGITLSGVDVTARLTGGSLGASIALRDTVIPTVQAELDALAAATATRFSQQGLTLFTDGTGRVPGSSTTASTPDGIVGFASQITVAQAVSGNAGLIASGDAGGAASSGVPGRIVTYAFGANAASGVPQTAVAATGLGPGGTLTASYRASGSLSDIAADLIASQGASASEASDALTNATALQTSLGNAIASVSSVSVDAEMAKMVALQNSYAANAKIVTAVQSMFSALLNAVTP